MKTEPGSDLKRAALGALKPYGEVEIAFEILNLYGSLPIDVRQVAGTLLAGRIKFAKALVRAVEGGKISPLLISPEVVSLLRSHNDAEVTGLVDKYFANTETDANKLEEEIKRLSNLVKNKPGNPYAGKKLFTTSCGSCHRLFESGGYIGPDLSTYQRDDVDTMLLSIVNPSAQIREGYENFLLNTLDGRTVVGFLVEQDNQAVVLRGLDGQDITMERKKIKEMRAQGVSLMPSGLLSLYTDDQVRDLLAYLRSTQPLNN